MTAKTGSRRLDARSVRLTVTGMTINRRVGARQRVIGRARMVEGPTRPAIRRMAAPAVWPQSPLVKCIRMADPAVSWRLSIILASMAGFTSDRRVEADKWKPRQIVVECDLLVPSRFIMTTFALSPE